MSNNRLYGICYLALENRFVFDPEKALELIHNMGFGSIRHWMHFSNLLQDPTTLNVKNVEIMHQIIEKTRALDIEIVGMNHTNFNHGKFSIGKVHPLHHSYFTWLKDYEESWYTLVKAFPKITYWEIDNELNNKDFMYIEHDRNYVMALDEMATLAIDMLFYASKGIKRANPKAITIMGGIVDTHAIIKGDPDYTLGTGSMIPFLKLMYDKIYKKTHGSTNPDDFFERVCWHPYYYRKALDNDFFELNEKIYNTILVCEGKHKGVFITEFGWSEEHINQKEVTRFIGTLFECVKQNMPYVETLHYFRLLNNLEENGQKYGLFYDPKPHVSDKNPLNGEIMTAQPKPQAFAMQKALNGNGDLSYFKKSKE